MTCSDCVHLVEESPVPGDPHRSYCTHAGTKEFRHPVGYVRMDAPACHLIQIRHDAKVSPAKLVDLDKVKYKIFKAALLVLFLAALVKVVVAEIFH